ncbi:hypothetical protein [Fimbriimonas ginsengisoli]|nr:hypothetical protein [Fimbriimonas ginsengisoli]
MTVASTKASVAPAHVSALGGEGGILVSWDPSPATLRTSLAGYRVVRTGPGTTIKTFNTVPITSTQFYDFTAVAGTSYTYKVKLMNSALATVTTSPTSGSATAITGNSVTWSANPAVDSSGTNVSFAVAPPTGTADRIYQAVVNGVVIGQAEADDSLGPYSTANLVRGSFDLERMAGTSYSVRIVAQSPSGFASSTPQTVTVPALPCNGLKTGDVVYTPDSTYSHFEFDLLPTGAYNNWSTWSVEIANRNAPTTILRTWVGLQTHAAFDWDGTDSNGNLLPSGRYVAHVTGPDHSTFDLPVPMMIATSVPRLLAMVTDLYPIAPWGPDNGNDYANLISSYVGDFQVQNPGYTSQVLYCAPNGGLSPVLAQLVRTWIQSPQLWDLYIYGHGNFQGIDALGHLKFCSYNWTGPDGRLGDASNNFIFSIPTVLQNRGQRFHWVFLDGCNTFGNEHNEDHPKALVTYNNLNAYCVPIGGVYYPPDVFMGWNGHSIANSTTVTTHNPPLTTWWYFRQAYWYSITHAGGELAAYSEGGATYFAMLQASLHATGAVDFIQYEPWETNDADQVSRYNFYEDFEFWGTYFLGEGP